MCCSCLCMIQSSAVGPHGGLEPVEVARDARVDAGHGRAAAAPERRHAHQPVEAVGRRQPLQRPARVALAGVAQAERVAGADLRVGDAVGQLAPVGVGLAALAARHHRHVRLQQQRTFHVACANKYYYYAILLWTQVQQVEVVLENVIFFTSCYISNLVLHIPFLTECGIFERFCYQCEEMKILNCLNRNRNHIAQTDILINLLCLLLKFVKFHQFECQGTQLSA